MKQIRKIADLERLTQVQQMLKQAKTLAAFKAMLKKLHR
jgi:hypothetical protein